MRIQDVQDCGERLVGTSLVRHPDLTWNHQSAHRDRDR